MSAIEVYLKSCLRYEYGEENEITSEIYNYLVNKHFDISDTKVTYEAGRISIVTKDEMITISKKIDNERVLAKISNQYIINDNDSVLNGYNYQLHATLDSTGLDLYVNILNDTEIYVGELWYADNVFLGEITDTYHLKSQVIDFDALNSLREQIKNSKLSLLFATSQMYKEIEEYATLNLEKENPKYIRKK